MIKVSNVTKYFDDFKDDIKLQWLYDKEKGQEKALYVAVTSTASNKDNALDFLYEILTYKTENTSAGSTTD